MGDRTTAPPRKEVKRKRVTLDLTPEAFDRLQAIEEMVGADSKASVIRQALQLYEYLAKRSLKGHLIKATGPEGQEETLVFFGSNIPPTD